MIATAAVLCPRCGRNETTPLARDGDLQRYQCERCSETFTGPAAPEEKLQAPAPERSFAHAPIATPEPSGTISVGGSGKCTKCGKPYLRLGKRFEKHVASCGGQPYQAPVRRPRRMMAFPSPPTPYAVYDQTLLALRARKLALEAEIRGVDAVIAEVEALRGTGGAPAPARPF